MALLNFAKTYEEVSNKLELPESESGEYVQLVFTKDGHIITHGVDYTPLFSTGIKGLVPGSNGKQTEFLRGNGRWLEITTADLPIPTSINDAISQGITETTILTTKQIIDYIGSSIAANDAMIYKGTITYADGKYTTHTVDGESVDGFPTICKVGDTYRVTTQATYADQQCEAGDLIICIKDGNGDSLNSSSYWTAIQTNINGQVKHTVNGTAIYTYSNSTNTFNIYAPITGGTQNQILLSNGDSAPTWANQNSIIAGDITDAAKKGLLTNVSLSTNGIVSVTVGGTTKSSSPASGTWGINISGSAGSVIGELSTGNGLALGTSGETYNGSVSRTLTLLPATTSTIGGVIVDSESEAERKTISVTSSGSIYLTKQNIVNALGYVPGSSDTLLYELILGSSATSTSKVDTIITNPFINLIQTSGSIKSVTGSYQLIGQGNIKVSGQNSVTISLGEANSDNYGGIKVGYQTNEKNYAVQLQDGKAYVSVPWSNTTYGLATATEDGLVPKYDSVGTGTLTVGSWVLSKLVDGTYDWFALPSQAFKDTWRDITIGGVSIGDKTLNFVPSGDVYLKTDSNGDEIQDISFGISWYNISTGKYETA